MTILGVDPGIGRNGWGIISEQKGIITAVGYDCIETDSKKNTEQRLCDIYSDLQSVISKYTPDVLAIEELFFNTNVKTALLVGQARGVVLLCAAQKSLPVYVYNPLQVKLALTGYGRADKNQISQMVKKVLSLSSIPKPDDTADALAIAITHAYSKRMNIYKL